MRWRLWVVKCLSSCSLPAAASTTLRPGRGVGRREVIAPRASCHCPPDRARPGTASASALPPVSCPSSLSAKGWLSSRSVDSRPGSCAPLSPAQWHLGRQGTSCDFPECVPRRALILRRHRGGGHTPSWGTTEGTPQRPTSPRSSDAPAPQSALWWSPSHPHGSSVQLRRNLAPDPALRLGFPETTRGRGQNAPGRHASLGLPLRWPATRLLGRGHRGPQ